MTSTLRLAAIFLAMLSLVSSEGAVPAMAAPFFFSTGSPDGKIATASRRDSPGKFEIESADDFVLTSPTLLTNATFTGLIPIGSSASLVVVEIYRVFQADSNVGRTSGPPVFSTPKVPTRVNSPSDVEFDSRDSSAGTLSFTTSVLQASFTASNSIQPGGIHPLPGDTTGGNGAITGQEVEFNLTFSPDFSLGPDHYFFVPQVELTSGDFYWLSAPRPIVPPGTPFPPGATDLQSWTRDANLDPDWLRIGTDIVGGSPAPTFNAAFSLTGVASVPEPSSLAVFGVGLLGLGAFCRCRKARA
jgi:hypothetical protein